ncbi:MAG: HD domain-containing protein [Gammaproteobacteria bacterium AqS3]|nr:HD domain-containing protein [Gammaproteobacteria bacterium AqS3]
MSARAAKQLIDAALGAALCSRPGEIDYDETAQLVDIPQRDGAAEVDRQTIRAALIEALDAAPHRFFAQLRRDGLLGPLFPEIDAMFGVPQPEHHHPEIDTGVHSLLVLAQAERLSRRACWRFAALTHDLGKARTPASLLPRHHGHEARGIAPLRALVNRYCLPVSWGRCAELAVLWHTHCHKSLELRPATLLKLIERLGAERHPMRLEGFLSACEADARGRPGYENCDYPQVEYLRRAASAVREVRSRHEPSNSTPVRRIQRSEILSVLQRHRSDHGVGSIVRSAA